MIILFIFRFFLSLNFAFFGSFWPSKSLLLFFLGEFLCLISEDQHIDYFYRLSLFFCLFLGTLPLFLFCSFRSFADGICIDLLLFASVNFGYPRVALSWWPFLCCFGLPFQHQESRVCKFAVAGHWVFIGIRRSRRSSVKSYFPGCSC